MTLKRLHDSVEVVAPIHGLRKGIDGVTIQFREEATQEQRAAAQEIVDAWDWEAPPPVELYPYEILALLRPEQIIALQTSVEPVLIILRSKLQTIVSPMPMAGAEMQQALAALVGYGLITQQEATKLTQGEPLS